MATIHHATRTRAANSGCEILERGEQFALRRTADEAVSEAAWDSAKAAADAAADPATVWVLPSNSADAPRAKSGVMKLSFHDAYTANGGGCGDTLDATLRETFLTKAEKGTESSMDREALIACAEQNGVWNPNWAGLNNGMVRMNTANRLRALLRNDAEATVTIGTETGRFGVEFRPAGKKAKKGA